MALKELKEAEIIAIALDYKKYFDAPKVVAKGRGEVAKKILQIARLSGIEIHKDADLAKILEVVELDDVIPLETFSAVASILSLLYKKNRELIDG